MIVKEATSISEWGVHVVGEAVNMIIYADDEEVVCDTQKGLQELMDNLNRETKEYRIKINAIKTKVMCISKKEGSLQAYVYIDGQ